MATMRLEAHKLRPRDEVSGHSVMEVIAGLSPKNDSRIPEGGGTLVRFLGFSLGIGWTTKLTVVRHGGIEPDTQPIVIPGVAPMTLLRVQMPESAWDVVEVDPELVGLIIAMYEDKGGTAVIIHDAGEQA